MHKLLIKTHNKTGLKYLCYTQKEDHDLYLGSGKYWKRHLKEHGNDITTELIYQTEYYEDFVSYARIKSIEYNVVESADWANLRIEEGDGGDTVSNLRWITNGIEDLFYPKNKELPLGWRYGRTNCNFNNSEFQKEMNSRVDRSKIDVKAATDKATATKRERNSFRDISGDNNPTKSAEVREKIKKAALERPIVVCPHCGKRGQLSPGMYQWHFDNCRNKNE